MAEVSACTLPLEISDIRSFRYVDSVGCPARGIVNSGAVSLPRVTVSPETSAMRHVFSASLIWSSTEAAGAAAAGAAAAAAAVSAGAAAFAESTAARSPLEEQAATAPAEIAHKRKARVNRPY